jgi:hypothetical protein
MSELGVESAAPGRTAPAREPLDFAFITTLSHNVGDDFVREGILHLLDTLGVLHHAEFIHKHSPITTVFGLEKMRRLRASRVLEPMARAFGARDRIAAADVLVQSGAPVYWCHPGGPHCADNEWFDPLIRRRFLPDRRGRPFLNIAGGSCQRYHSDGSEIASCPKCLAYVREFFDACTLTLLRDRLARRMLNLAGRDAEVLPCTSIFARDRLRIAPQAGEFIVINGMEGGGHYDFGQGIDAGRWRERFRELARLAQERGRVVVACHNEAEESLAKATVPHVERFLVPNDHVEFMKFYARARFGIVNRVHAAFMMASFGKPAAVIGNDSRARMIETLNLETRFVGDVQTGVLEELLERVGAKEPTYRDEIGAIRSAAREKYLNALEEAICIGDGSPRT